MNYFLTGDLHIGKSTLIRKTLQKLGWSYGGFCTSFGPYRNEINRYLYIHRADRSLIADTRHAVAAFHNDRVEAYPAHFDELGCRYLAEAESFAEITVMDELGGLEKDARQFQRAVFKMLDGKPPVLGVIRQGFPGWTKEIAERADVCVITVTIENRDELSEKLADRILMGVPLFPEC